MEQSELRKVLNGVREGNNFARQCFEILDRASRNSGRRRLVHGVDHYAGVVESQDAICLVTVGEKAAGERLPDDKGDDRVTSQSSGAVSVRGRSGGQIDGGGLFTPA